MPYVIHLIYGYIRNNGNELIGSDIMDMIMGYYKFTWNNIINVNKSLGFKGSTIISKQDFKTLACSSRIYVASAYWLDKNIFINENQELLDEWERKAIFYFYATKFKIIKKPNNNIILGTSGKKGCIALKLKQIYIIVAFDRAVSCI